MKALVIGIDGGSYNIIDGLMARGAMPHLASVLKQGVRGELSVHANHRGWATLMTGLDPSHHGGFYWQRVPGTYGLNDAFSLADYDHLAIWSAANEAGLRVGMAGMPTTFPPPKVEGFVIANGGGGIGPRDPAEAAYPLDLLDELPELRNQRLDVRYADYVGRSVRDYFTHLAEIVRQRTAACMHLFQSRAPDLGILAFEGPDRMLHWFYDDVAAAAEGASGREDSTPHVLEYFGALDEAIGAAVAAYAEECPILIVSDHGFVRHDFDLRINVVLEEVGLAVPSRSVGRRVKEVMLNQAIDRLPPSVRVAGKRLVKRRYGGGQAAFTEPPMDWSRTHVFGHSGAGVYVNRQGRMRAGIVPDAEFDDVVRRTIDLLSDYRLPGADAPLFSSVRDVRDVYEGPVREKAPDVVFDLPPGYEVSRRVASGLPLRPHHVPPRSAGSMPRVRSGIHGTRAMFAAVGRGVPTGRDIGLADMRRFRDTMAEALQLPALGQETLW